MSDQRSNVTQAFDLAKERYESLAIVCGILNISNAYAYRSMKEGEVSLPCALKMELILDGEFTWRDLCPKVAKKVDSIKDRIASE